MEENAKAGYGRFLAAVFNKKPYGVYGVYPFLVEGEKEIPIDQVVGETLEDLPLFQRKRGKKIIDVAPANIGKEILKLRFLQDKTQKETAGILGMSENNVARLEQLFLRHIRRSPHFQRLRRLTIPSPHEWTRILELIARAQEILVQLQTDAGGD